MRSLLGLVIALLPVLAAATVAPTPAGKHLFTNVSTVYEFDKKGSWIANVACRPNGNLVAIRTDVPEVWAIDVQDNTAMLVATIPYVSSLIGMTQIDDDVFVITGGNISLSTLEPVEGSFSVWTVRLFPNNDAAVSLITTIPEAKFLHGVATLQHYPDATIVLIADAVQNAIYRLDTTTALYSIAQQNSTYLTGVNNIIYQGGYVYYTATTNQVFGRVAVDWQNGSAIKDYEVIFNNTGIIPDGFSLSNDGHTAYMATFVQNSVAKIPLQDPKQPITTLYGGLNSTEIPGPTTVYLQRNGFDNILYVPTSGGLIAPVDGTYVEPAKIVAIVLSDEHWYLP